MQSVWYSLIILRLSIFAVSLAVAILRVSYQMHSSNEHREKGLIGSLKHARFRDSDGNRKWAVFPFNLSSDSHFYIAKYVFSIKDD